MKKLFLGIAAIAASISLNAQYVQTLPLDYTDFFRADAIAEDGEHLERGAYIVGAAQGTNNPFMGDQWNLSSKSDYRARTNPNLVSSELSWSNYIDNAKGKAIVFDGSVSDTRISIYSLQSNNTYSSSDGSKVYYLAALVNFTTVSSSAGVDFLSFDGNYTSTTARGRVCVKKGSSSSKHHIGMEYSSTPGTSTVWSSELNGGDTHLIVVKIKPNTDKNTDNIESADLWLDPDLSKSEAENADAKIVSVTGKGIGSIRGINIVQKKNLTGQVAGLRFGDNWADVAKKADGGATAIDEAAAGTKAKVEMIDGHIVIRRGAELYSVTGQSLK